jgi:hypothetical protein
MMRTFLFTLIVLLSSAGMIRADGSYEALQRDDLNFYFSNIQAEDGKLVFTRSSQDLSFRMQIGTAPKTDCLPNTMFAVPFGTACRVFNSQSNLKFIPPAPKAEQSMFLVERVNRRNDVCVGILLVTKKREIKVLPVNVADKDALYKFEKNWVLGTGSYPSAH